MLLLNDDNDDSRAEPPDGQEIDNQNERIDGESDKADMQTLTIGKVPANIRKGVVKIRRLPESVGKIRLFSPDGKCVMAPADAESADLWELGLTKSDLALLMEGVEPGKVVLQARYENDTGADFYPSGNVVFHVIAFRAVVPGDAYDDISLSEQERADAEAVEADIVAEGQPRPSVEIVNANGSACTSMDVVVDATAGVARLTLHGYVRDPLADNTPAGAGRDIASVTAFHRFLADETSAAEEKPVNTVPVIRLPEEKAGAKGFWRQHPYRGEFKNLKVAIPLVEGKHAVRVQTSANAIGQSAWDEIIIDLRRAEAPAEKKDLPAAADSSAFLTANIHIGTDLLPDQQEEIRFYFGDREPRLPPAAGADPAMLEVAPDSLVFAGKIRDLAGREMPATARITHARSQASAVAAVNAPPLINAGPDRVCTANPLCLAAQAWDDGLPAGGNVSCQWSKISGPGNAVFTAPRALSTEVSFSSAGTYVLRLSASDGDLTASDEITVVYTADPAALRNRPPRLKVPAAQSCGLNESLALRALIVDDGLPENSAVTATWSMVQGPGTATFAETGAACTQVLFSAPGIYLLRLTASDGSLFASADTIVSVAAIGGALTAAAQPLRFDPMQPDAIKAAVEWRDANGASGSCSGDFTESGPDTKRFCVRIPLAACSGMAAAQDGKPAPLLWLKTVARGSRSPKG
ncbi:MAG: PKD domain-containing protein, partial [Planctomycetota bacterium]|nr:PKD domain-containing protein [Planctomycetota bacterium]